ncbi:MAG: DUF1566 domain-containing protein [Nitrospirae bacterium]|nr:DUF1566 domain-containing protein [Nitrospirota bacterium]
MEKTVMRSIMKHGILITLMLCLMLTALPGMVIATNINLPQTGQSSCWDASGNSIACTGTGQDGAIKAGVAWPSPRFTNTGNTVTDNLTGIMWTTNANLPSETKTWQATLDYVASMNTANSGAGTYGHNDWRLPNRNELRSLSDYSQSLPAGNPFINVQQDGYWSHSTVAGSTSYA